VRTQLISIIGYINILPLENLTKLITKALNQIPTAEFPIYLADEYLAKYSKEVYDQKVSETI
jgi:hypothetical protein